MSSRDERKRGYAALLMTREYQQSRVYREKTDATILELLMAADDVVYAAKAHMAGAVEQWAPDLRKKVAAWDAALKATGVE